MRKGVARGFDGLFGLGGYWAECGDPRAPGGRCDLPGVCCTAEGITFLPKAEILSLEEFDPLCSAIGRFRPVRHDGKMADRLPIQAKL